MSLIDDPTDPRNPDPNRPDQEQVPIDEDGIGGPRQQGGALDENNPAPDTADPGDLIPPDLPPPPDTPVPQGPPPPSRPYSYSSRGSTSIGRYRERTPSGEIDFGPDQASPGPGEPPDPEIATWDVENEQLASFQTNKLLEEGSPLLEMTKQRALRQHMAQGGQNSLMATQAGEMAVIDKAFQIGREDAAVYARSAEFNAAMTNQFNLAEQRFFHEALLSEQNFEQSKILQQERIRGEFDARWKLSEQQHAQFFDQVRASLAADLSKMRTAAGLQEAQAQRDFSRSWTLNASQNWVSFYQQGFAQTGEILSNPNLSPEQANAAAEQYQNLIRGGLDVLQGFYGRGMAWTGGSSPNYATWNETPWWQRAPGG